LVDALSWRAIFLINLPVVLVALAIVRLRVPESRDDAADDAAVDWQGGLLATAGLGAIAYGLTDVSELGWTHPTVLAALAAGALVLALFVRHEARTRSPMMPLGL